MDDTRRSLELGGVYELLTATGIDDVRTAYAETRIDHVIMGAESTRIRGSRSHAKYSYEAKQRRAT